MDGPYDRFMARDRVRRDAVRSARSAPAFALPDTAAAAVVSDSAFGEAFDALRWRGRCDKAAASTVAAPRLPRVACGSLEVAAVSACGDTFGSDHRPRGAC